MSTESYTKTIQTTATAEIAYAALTHKIGQWWTKSEGSIRAKGDIAKFTFPPNKSYWTFEAVELTPNSQIILKCVDALHIHEGLDDAIEQEWLGTTIIWDIKPTENGCEINMIHQGLKPQLLCYDICQMGWDHFFQNSLRALLNTGTGTPHMAG